MKGFNYIYCEIICVSHNLINLYAVRIKEKKGIKFVYTL
ncbi:hypothetical protein XSR1_420002 [Xenorhabdus szentirmaii DSM 16338]|uniref:Uncharacterized protein n=1 Tax=Xenorhabdus szentirmaii DSM 16338 TaxID=1427518 RepID=W1J459_9GAMM|nr:hypothetical protein XSR1_420002 [Xenorhabdus szentirmaii DSM 16338]